MKRIDDLLMFPVGTKVQPNEENLMVTLDFIREFRAHETRPYMIVTGHNNDGWLKFDNTNYTLRGGAWNPNRFKKYVEKNILPEDLFTI